MKKTILLLAAMVALSVLPAKAWDNMYLIGTATTAGYSLDKAIQMTGSGDQFVWTGNLTAGELKFLTDKGWYNMYGPAHNEFSTESSDRKISYNQLVIGATYELQLFSPTEGITADPADPAYEDYKFGVSESEAGVYSLIVNTTNRTLVVRKYPTTIYPVGDGCAVGWDTSGKVAFVETGEDSGIYQGTLNLAAVTGGESALKFLCQKDWGTHFGPAASWTEIGAAGVYNVQMVTDGDEKFKIGNIPSGTYNMTLDANTGKLYIVPQEISVKAQIEMGALEEMGSVNCHVWTELVPGEAKDITDIVPTEDGWFEAKVTGVYGPINFLYYSKDWNVKTPDMKNDNNGYYTDKCCTIYAEKQEDGKLKCNHNDDNTVLSQTITLEFKVAQDTTWVGENNMFLREWQNMLDDAGKAGDKATYKAVEIISGIYTFKDIPVVNQMKFVLQTVGEGWSPETLETSTYKSQKYWISKENGAYKLIATDNFDKDPTTLVEQTATINDNIVYDITGRALGTSVENLPQGIYVRNGKKFIVAQ
ncbi:MAG: hypothetical protein ACI4BD_06175 [Paludibacteraceae bacterium]